MTTPAFTRAERFEVGCALDRLGSPNGDYTRHFRQSSTPNKGEAVFATEYIRPGTLILSEEPAFYLSSIGNTMTQANINRLQQEANNVPFRALYCPPVDPARPKPDIVRQFEANNFQMSPMKLRNCRQGIFIQAARFNHSCLPNAHFAWNLKLGRLTIHAIDHIKQDDEIVVKYRSEDSFTVAAERDIDLQRIYGFRCDCRACRAGFSYTMASDQRRIQMEDLEDNIIAPGSRAAKLKEILKLRGLLEEEFLYPQLARVYE